MKSVTEIYYSVKSSKFQTSSLVVKPQTAPIKNFTRFDSLRTEKIAEQHVKVVLKSSQELKLQRNLI